MWLRSQIRDESLGRETSDSRFWTTARRLEACLRGVGAEGPQEDLAGSRTALRQTVEAAIGVRLPHYEQEYVRLDECLRSKLERLSAETIDRLLAPCRVSLGKRTRCGNRPGTPLRKEIPVRTEHWDVQGPGWVEADTVAHCGESMERGFCCSLTVTDVHAQWTETSEVWNRRQHNVRQMIVEIEKALAFDVLGFDREGV